MSCGNYTRKILDILVIEKIMKKELRLKKLNSLELKNK